MHRGFESDRILSRNPVNSNPNSENRPPIRGKSPVSVIRFFVAAIFTVIFWPLAVLFGLIISVASRFFLDVEAHRRFGRHALGTTMGIFIGVLEFFGIIRVSDGDLKQHANVEGPLLIACNHPALWDALLIIRRFVSVTCIMKQGLLENPLLRNGALFAGFLSNTPRLQMIRAGLERLARGERLLLFPEGTRTREENGKINPFLPGLALLAKQSGAPILPIFISSNSRYLEKGWPIWRMPDLPISISIRVGDQILNEPDEKVRDLSARLERIFRDELG